MQHSKGVPLEVECPQCGKILFCRVRTAEDYPKTCVCGAKLREPDPDTVDWLAERRRFEDEFVEQYDNFMSTKYGYLKLEDYTDEINEERRRDDEAFRKKFNAGLRALQSRRIGRRREKTDMESTRSRVDRERKGTAGVSGTGAGGSELSD